ncbi:MAG TPA: neuraminidase-like domain-containing protein [Chitinophagales bacterium]|nr:neuraminidase-like domain-containing protein [Chitinophagales bacterium]
MKKQTRSKKTTAKKKTGTPVKEAAAGVNPIGDPIENPVIDLPNPDVVLDPVEQPIQLTVTFSGTVKHSTGNAIAGLTVTVYRRDVFSKTPLATAITDSNGTYSAYFNQLAETNIAYQVEVLDADVTLASSDVFLKIATTNTVDFTISDPNYKGTPKFSQHSTLLNDVLTQVKANAATQKLSTGDLYLIANNKGCSAQDAYHWLKAQECSDNTGIEAEVFYGLFKSGLPASLMQLGYKKGDEIKKALQDAATNNHISDDMSARADDIVQQWYSYVANRALTAKADQLDASLGDILSIVIEDKDVHQQIMMSYLNNEGTLEDFWNNLPAITGSVSIADDANLVLRLAAFNGMQPYMTMGLLDESKKYKGKNYFRIMARYDKWNMNNHINIWSNQYKQETIVPKFIVGENESQRRVQYAEVLTDKLKKQFPTQRLLGDLMRKQSAATDTVAGAAAPAAADAEKTATWEDVFETPMSEMITFLQHNTEFEFADVDSKTFGEGTTLNLSGVKDVSKLKSDAGPIKVLFSYTTNTDAIITLLNDDIMYSGNIVSMTKSVWVANYGNLFESEAEAENAYAVAYTNYYMCLAAYGMIHPGLNISLAAVPSIKDNPAMADWRTMFGSIDTCECEHCMSVYSPSAYYADLLSFIRQRAGDEDSDGVTLPYAQLILRRNDLLHIDLSCENANTPMPYVDLVIELLENYILNLPGSSDAPKSYQTRGTAAELAANPQHVYKDYDADGNFTGYNDYLNYVDAYVPLKSAVFPLPLPFNFPLEEARVYLKHLGIPRHEIMTTFFSGNETEAFTNYDINIERYQISPEEGKIIIGETTGDGGGDNGVWNFYGFNTKGTAIEIVDPQSQGTMISMSWDDYLDETNLLNRRVDIFLQQTKLTYKELLTLLECNFINPFIADGIRAITTQAISGDNATCQLDELKLNGMTEDHLKKIHCFIRLWRKLNWDMWDLDRALMVFHTPELNSGDLKIAPNGEDLNKVTQANRLHQLLHLPLEVVLSFWSNISYASYTDYFKDDYPEIPSLYEKLFLNKAVIGELDGEFAIDKINDAVAEFIKSVDGTIDHTPTIFSALQISADDLELLAAALKLDWLLLPIQGIPLSALVQLNPSDGLYGLLTVKNLSSLHRYAVLARKLNYEIADFLLVLELTGMAGGLTGLNEEYEGTPDLFADPKTTFEFLRKEKLLKASGFSLDEVNYLLHHVYTDESGVALTDDKIGVFLSALRAALRANETVTDEEQKNTIAQKFAEELGITTTASQLLLVEYIYSTFDEANPKKIVDDFWVDDFSASDFLKIYYDEDGITPTEPEFERSVDGSTSIDVLFDDYIKLWKIAQFITRLILSDTDLEFALKNSAVIGCIDFDTIPVTADSPGIDFSKFEMLIQLITARDVLPAGTPDFFDIINLSSPDEWMTQLMARIGWELDDDGNIPEPFITIRTLLDVCFSDNLQNGYSIIRTLQCLKTFDKLGLDVEIVNELVDIANEVDNTTSEAVKNAAKAKHDEASWFKVAKPLRDQLREKQREALVAYVLVHTDTSGDMQKTWRNSDEMYEYFLIDPEMKPINMTSRLKQAICSVQLFIDRVLLGVEHKGNDPSGTTLSIAEEQEDEWKTWRKLYRVWEANRKIFLYPENWLEPELRDNKSPLFKELESQLLQNELSDENVEDAFLAYLEKLDEVARLEIVGLYHQTENTGDDDATDDEDEVDIVHVFGRTYSNPHKYFYRKLEEGEWSAWEAMEIDIDSNHIAPVIFNRRLCLFWLFWLEQSEEASSGDNPPPPARYWQIQLAWSEYKNGKWTGKKLSEESIESTHFDFQTSEEEDTSISVLLTKYRKNIFLYTGISNEKLQFALLKVDSDVTGDFYDGSNEGDRVDAYFSLSNLSENPNVSYEYANRPPYFAPDGTKLDKMMFTEDSDNNAPGSIFYSYDNSNDPYVLDQTPKGLYRLVTPKKYETNPLESEFFFQDNENTFYVIHADDSTVVEESNSMEGTPYDFGSIPIVTQELFQNFVSGTQLSVTETQASNFFEVELDAQLAGQYVDSIPVYNFTAGVEPVIYQAPQVALLMEEPPAMQEAAGDAAMDAQLSNPYTQAGGLAVNKYLSGEKFTFQTHFHPQIKSFISQLNKYGIEGLLKRKLENQDDEIDFEDTYVPNQSLVATPYPGELEDGESAVDFSYSGSYSIYNFELFFHAPMLIACRLSTDQRFEEARNWFHYIFDPTRSNAEEPPVSQGKKERFWQFFPFYQKAQEEPQTLEELIKSESDELQEQIAKWMENPFQPHVIARLRLTAYMKNVVMKYLDNLIAWGDQLFRRDTIESITEASNLYILAGKILGDRPQEIPPRSESLLYTFKELIDIAGGDLDDFSNVMVLIESMINGASAAFGTGDFMGSMYYFCVIANEKLLTYWDTVADRLFKIRHSMNIEGVVRTLPIYDPPIDPAMLVRAAAMGMDLSSILSDMDVALPNYRFNFMIQKANELCNEVKSLGSSLLQALEKKDAEAMALLRSTQEQNVLKAVLVMKEKQVDEAEENAASAEKAIDMAQKKIDYYSTRKKTNSKEDEQAQLSKKARNLQEIQAGIEMASSFLGGIPDAKLGFPTTIGATYGGSHFSNTLTALSRGMGILSSINSYKSNSASAEGSYERRWDEWKFQEKLASKEIEQATKQKLAADIRLAIAQKDLKNQQLQIDNAAEMDEFMRSKFTNQQLYEWMIGQLATVYFQSYQLAYDVAKKAQKCYNYELGNSSAEEETFIQFGYWDSLKKGLLSAEKLQFDLRRMEVSYLENNKRTYEVNQSFSLALLNSEELVKLKASGSCNFDIPEIFYDLYYPGQYRRLIKSVRISIPSIAGPYTNVSAKLTMISSAVRFTPDIAIDPELISGSTSIATSNAQNDGGMFELNFRDERFLPFEGKGAISSWLLELPGVVKMFDYNTISDVIVQVSYTALDDGGFRETVENNIAVALSGQPLYKLFSLKHDFPNDFYKMQNGGSLDLIIGLSHFPFFAKQMTITLSTVSLYDQNGNDLGISLVPTKEDSGDWKLTFDLTTVKDAVDVLVLINYKLSTIAE